MEATTPLSADELASIKPSKKMLTEATSFKTVPTGKYLVRAKAHNTSRDKQGRVVTNFTLDVLGEDGTRKATTFLKVSPEEQYTSTGNLDSKAKLYGQLNKALGLDDSASILEMTQVFMVTPVRATIELVFKGEKDPVTGWPVWLNPKTDEETADYRARGYEATNQVRGISKAE